MSTRLLSSVASKRRWIFRPRHPEFESEVKSRLRLSGLAARLLRNRGVSELPDIRAFLRPGLKNLADPRGLSDIEAAVARILRARRDGDRVLLYGDYDVDGMSSSALLARLFRFLGLRFEIHVPNRLDEGYGLRRERLRRAAEEGVTLVVTVDNGIVAFEEAEAARELGLDLIITDHHEPGDGLPDAVAVVNPKLGEDYPFPDLAGVGVAFKLAWAIGREMSNEARVTPEFRAFLLEALGLVALGTVADCVPLRHENRILVSHGLRALGHTEQPGLRALMGVARVRLPLDASDVAFRLAPRLNAAGRLGKADLAVQLLMTDDAAEANQLAEKLDAINQERRQLEERVTLSAEEGLPADLPAGILLADEDWHEGVIGIVASRFVEKVHRPVVLVSMKNGVGRGSARSIPGIPIHEVLADCTRFLRRHGGHAMAGGLEVEREKLPAFREAFIEAVERRFDVAEAERRLEIDAELPLSFLDRSLMQELKRLAPFGAENPRPVLAATGLKLVGEPRPIGAEGRHLRFEVEQNGARRQAVAFGKAHRLMDLIRWRDNLALAFHPSEDRFRPQTPELEVLDIRAGG